MSRYLSVFTPTLTIEMKTRVLLALDQGEISGTSKIVAQFELQYAESVERKFGVAVSNGSTALELAFDVLTLSPGDEVILPSFAIISCLLPILRRGLLPVFVDSDPADWNMDCNAVIDAITNKTKVILAVHTYGLAVDTQLLDDVCRERGIYLVEDAAEAHGLCVNNRRAGSFGIISTFSFYANKHVTCGEGGMVLTDVEELNVRLKSARNLAFGRENRFIHEDLGWNYRMGGLAAALGIGSLSGLDETIRLKKMQAQVYDELFLSHKEILKTPIVSNQCSQNNYWVYGVIPVTPLNRNHLTQKLDDIGIETRPFFFPLHKQPMLQKFPYRVQRKLEVAEEIGERGLYLPMGAHLSVSDQEFIVDSLISQIKLTHV